MIYNTNSIYGKVWKITEGDSGKYLDLRMSTSEKKEDGSYVSSNWYPRAIGHSLNSLKNLKEGDRIIITKSKLTNEPYEDKEGNKKSSFRFIIFEATIQDEEEAKGNTENKPVKQPKKQEAQATETEETPW